VDTLAPAVTGMPRMLLRIEGACIFAIAIVLYSRLGESWWAIRNSVPCPRPGFPRLSGGSACGCGRLQFSTHGRRPHPSGAGGPVRAVRTGRRGRPDLACPLRHRSGARLRFEIPGRFRLHTSRPYRTGGLIAGAVNASANETAGYDFIHRGGERKKCTTCSGRERPLK
jgi:hypothetical protein